MMKRILFSLCFCALFFSCNSDDDSNAESQSNFYGLQIGNSWNYKIYHGNSMNQDLDYYGVNQDVSVVAIEDIFDDTYYKLSIVTSGVENNNFHIPNGETIEFRRIEGGTLLNEMNQIVFINNDFTERLISEDSWGHIFNQTLEELATITVDAGEFTCTEMLIYAKLPDGEQLNGLDHYYYADGIGLVSSSVSFVSSGQVLYKTILNSYEIQ